MKLLAVALAAVFAGVSARAQSAPQPQETLRIEKVDPPNWFAGFPKPMLLVRGEGFTGATFSLSDAKLRIEKAVVSENGHWAQLWLNESPAEPERVTLRVSHGSEQARAPYVFARRRAANDGFAGFSSRDVMYLIMQDRFADGDLHNDGVNAKSSATSEAAQEQRAQPHGWHGGDLDGVREHLDYLQKLGVTTVWLTPVYQNREPDSYHGYGATDMYAVDDHFGTLEDLRHLSAALHARGMKLVLDTVPNHVGPANPWVKDEPTPNWFHGTLEHHLEAEPNYEALLNPHAPQRDRDRTLHGWFANALPDMDTDDPTVAQYLRQNVIWWIEETGADGLRIDTFAYVNREFWHDLLGEVNELFPHVTEVGEILDPSERIVSSWAGGVTRGGLVDTRLWTPFDYPMQFAVVDVFAKGAPMTKLNDVLGEDGLYPHPERLTVFFGNHDVTRFRELAPSDSAERLAFAYVLTTRGMPELYAGDEIGMRGKADPDNRRDFPGGFPGDAQDAFTRAGRTPEQQAMYSWVSDLTHMRREHPALMCGGEQVLSAGKDWFVMMRDAAKAPIASCAAGSNERVLVAFHRGDAAWSQQVKLDETWMQGCHLQPPVVATGDGKALVSGDMLTLSADHDAVLVAACQ